MKLTTPHYFSILLITCCMLLSTAAFSQGYDSVTSATGQTPTPTATPTATMTPTPTATPTATPQLVNIAVNKPVQVSSEYDVQYGSHNAVDGNEATVWGSAATSSSEWIYVDLGSVTQIDGIGLKWYLPYFAASYQVGISNDGVNWSIVLTQNNDGTDVELLGSGSCRYIGVLFTAKNSVAIGVKEFEVYKKM